MTDSRFERSFNINGQLPLDVLSPEALERIRRGGEPTEAEMTAIRSAALANSGVVGRLIGAALASGAFEKQRAEPVSPVEEPDGGVAGAVLVPGSVQRFEWRWDGGSEQAQGTKPPPRTYFELLTGQPDPLGDTLSSIRRLLNYALVAILLGVPAVLIGIAVATGQPLDTIFFIAVFSIVVAGMIWQSFPRSPFG